MKKKGFTIVENIICIFIIIIIFSLAVSSYAGIRKIMANIELDQLNYEIMDILVYGKKYCRKYNTYGNFETNIKKDKIIFSTYDNKRLKEVIVPKEFIFSSNLKLMINNKGKITRGGTIIIKNKRNKEYLITIRVGIDLIRQKEN